MMMKKLCTALVAAGLVLATSPVAAASPTFGSVDNLGRPTPSAKAAALAFADNPAVPPALSSGIRRVIGFLSGEGTPGVEVPANGPAFRQFFWPTVAQNCIDGSHQAVATAIAVPGPASLPLPGVKAHHTSFVFTILGTGTVVTDPGSHLYVDWINLKTGRTGRSQLVFGGINPAGPATVNATANTGSGPVLSAISGSVTTRENGHDSRCTFAPTVGFNNS